MIEDSTIIDIITTKEKSRTGISELEFKLKKIDYTSVKKLLIINPTALGDIIASTGLVNSLGKLDIEIHYLIAEPYSFIIKYNNHIKKIHEIPIKFLTGSDIKFRVKLFRDLLEKINSEKYDAVINLHPSIYSTKLTTIINAPFKTGLLTEDNQIINQGDLNVFCKYFIPYLMSSKMSMLSINISQVYHFIAQVYDYTCPGLEIKKNINVSDNKLIGIVPGAAWDSKRWPPENFSILINLIQKKFDYDIILVLSPQEKEISDTILKNVNHREKIIVSFERYTLDKIPAVINNCSLVIGNDTGPAHIAASLGIPVITLISSGDGIPASDNNIVIFPCVDCIGCGKEYCPEKNKCIDLIEPGSVFTLTEWFIENDFKIKNTPDKNKIQKNINIFTTCLINKFSVTQVKINLFEKPSIDIVINDILTSMFLLFTKYINIHLKKLFNTGSKPADIKNITDKNRLDFVNILLEVFISVLNEPEISIAELKKIKKEFENILIEYQYISRFTAKLERCINVENLNDNDKYKVSTIFARINEFEQKVKDYSANKYIKIFDVISFSKKKQSETEIIFRNYLVYLVKENIITMYVKHLDSLIKCIYNKYNL